MSADVTRRTKQDVADTVWKLYAWAGSLRPEGQVERLLVAGARAALFECMSVVTGNGHRDAMSDDEVWRALCQRMVAGGKAVLAEREGE